MKLPFVVIPRAIYDEQREDVHQLRRTNAKLLRVIVKMKVAGGSIPRALPGIRLERKEPDAIEVALDENPKTRTDMRLRARLRAWADRQLRTDPGDENRRRVEYRIRTWSVVPAQDDTDDEDDDDDDLIAVTA